MTWKSKGREKWRRDRKKKGRDKAPTMDSGFSEETTVKLLFLL